MVESPYYIAFHNTLWQVRKTMQANAVAAFFGETAEADAHEYFDKLNERYKPLYSTTEVDNYIYYNGKDSHYGASVAWAATKHLTKIICEFLNSQEMS